MKIIRAVAGFAMLWMATCGTNPVEAQAPKSETKSQKDTRAAISPAPAAANPAAHELAAADLEAYLDGLVPDQLARDNIAGAVISVVKDGKVLFAKGYGFADVEKRTPVTPGATLFRPGSISKLFTWTSVMQLVEQGKLDLDKDVNDYLDFKIPPAFGQPITLKNIMTHTAGFEETGRDLFVADVRHMYPLDQYLKNRMPERIFPPGAVPAYSNYATAVAGYIVQRVSGEPFGKYVEAHIFKPLEMQRTTFAQPLPEDLKPLMSSGYVQASQKAQPFEFVEAYPAGSVATTARDMSNFMIAHLQDGRFGDVRILRPETARQMHSRLFGADDRLNGMAHGFYEETRNGHRIVGHGGDTVLFHSDLHLVPDANIGFFVSYNSAGKGVVRPRTILFDGFLDRYFPYTPPAGQTVAGAKAHAAEVAGLYKTSRRFESSFMRMTTPLGEVEIDANADGAISSDTFKKPNGEPVKFEEIGPYLYRERHGQSKIGFKKDSAGNWQFQTDYPYFIFQKCGFLENKYFVYAVLIFGMGVILLTLLLWPVAAIVRKRYGKKLDMPSADLRLRFWVRMVCLLFLALFLGWALALSMADDTGVFNGLAPWVVFFGILAIVCTLGTPLVCFNAFRSCKASGRWIWTKLHDLGLALACLALIWFLFTWNLMNFRLHF
jgi:CubicO group peptidase (beta-lactamase class C family)